MTAIKTIVADKQTMFVEGLKALSSLDNPPLLNIVDVVASAEELLESVQTHNVEFVILDLNLAGDDGLAVIPKIRALDKELKMCVLTSYSDHKFVKNALMNGANGYILKSNTKEDLKEGIVNIFNDKTYLAPGLHITPPKSKFGVVPNGNGPKSLYEDRFMIKRKLTSREQEVLSLITQAKNNREIAEELFISDQTVGVHRKNIMRKLGVRNTVNLIKFALEHQLV